MRELIKKFNWEKIKIYLIVGYLVAVSVFAFVELDKSSRVNTYTLQIIKNLYEHPDKTKLPVKYSDGYKILLRNIRLELSKTEGMEDITVGGFKDGSEMVFRVGVDFNN